MGVVNTVPTGLLDLLAAKTGGKNPTFMLENLQPVISLDQFYVNKKLGVVNGSLSTTGVGAAASTTVPPGELWQLVSLGHTYTATAANDFIGVQFVANNLPGSDVPGDALPLMNVGEIIGPTIGQLYGETLLLPYPLMLPAGANINLVCLSRVGTRTVNFAIGFYRYRV